MSKVTLKQIARALSLSVSTVSRALADSHEIGAGTKRKVREYAEQHNYIPNRHAMSLKTGRTNTIAIIACNIKNTFVSQVLDGIQSSLMEEGIDTFIMQSRDDAAQERHCLENVISKGVDGILISPVGENTNIDLMQKLQSNYPIILFDRVKSPLQTYKIGADNEGGAFEGTQHLIRRGRKRIGIILGEGLGVSEQRLAGYKKALAKFRIPFDEKDVLYLKLGVIEKLDREFIAFIQRARKQEIPIDALLLGSETISTRGIGLIAEAGIRVPEEVAVVGFANTTFAFSLNPSLTTIVQPAYEMGRQAVAKLLDVIERPQKQQFETLRLKTQLVIRKSSGFYPEDYKEIPR